MFYTYFYPSFIGDLCLVADERNLLSLSFEDEICAADNDEIISESEIISKTICQLDDYFSGRRSSFDLPLKISEESFSGLVLIELGKIPFGEVVTYGEIALRINNPKAARAVGTACKRNPYAIVIPCHRVVSASKGVYSGYAGGIDKKIALLNFEKNVSNKIL